MTREEFLEKAVLDITCTLLAQNNGAWKLQIDKAIEIAQYLTTQVHGEYIEPFRDNVN
jgi:hypothetical protein